MRERVASPHKEQLELIALQDLAQGCQIQQPAPDRFSDSLQTSLCQSALAGVYKRREFPDPAPHELG